MTGPLQAWRSASPQDRRRALRAGTATAVELLLTIAVFAMFFGAAAFC